MNTNNECQHPIEKLVCVPTYRDNIPVLWLGCLECHGTVGIRKLPQEKPAIPRVGDKVYFMQRGNILPDSGIISQVNEKDFLYRKQAFGGEVEIRQSIDLYLTDSVFVERQKE